MERRRIVALVNRSGGTVERQGVSALRQALMSAFAKHGMSVTLEFLPGADVRAGAERATQKVTAGEIDAVVVGGGDGTIRTVVSVLAGSGISLGILPLGTMNHFAKDLSIPLALDEAVSVIAAGVVRAVDVGEVNGRIFVNNSSIGLYPHMVLDRERIRRRNRLPKWIAMVLAALQVLRYFPLLRLSIQGEGWGEPCRSPCVFVGNNEYRPTGSALGRRERLDGGKLCVYVARQQSRLALILLACRLLLGLVDQSRDLRTFELPTAEIRSRRHRLLVALDGEVEVIRIPLNYRIRPGALRVFAPAATPG
jgi:diacylglycerol kinase family enzyme